VHVEFGDKSESGNFIIRGIEAAVSSAGNKISFMYSGDMNELISKLSGNNIINLMIEEPSLEEIFMHYYKL
jgi:ABC-2 type transport system ATP-binding protein